MVRVVQQDPSDDERLDALIARLADAHGLRLDRTGWSRKTYDLYLPDTESDRTWLVARVESLATTSGEVRVFDQRGLPFAEALAADLERAFGLKEATVLFVSPSR